MAATAEFSTFLDDLPKMKADDVCCRLQQLYSGWEPTFSFLRCVDLILTYLGIPETGSLRDAGLGLAESMQRTTATNPYHGPGHAIQVAVNGLVLGEIWKRQESETRGEYDSLCLALAGLGHDIGHDGTTNRDTSTGRIVPFRLEKIADATVRKLLSGTLPEPLVETISVMILATDPLFKRKIALAHDMAMLGCLASGGACLGLPAEIASVVQSPNKAVLAAMLVDADVLASAGLGADEHRRQTRLLEMEQGRSMRMEQTRFFLTHIVGESFASAAGRVFDPGLRSLRRSILGDEADFGDLGSPLHPEINSLYRGLVQDATVGGGPWGGLEAQVDGGCVRLMPSGLIVGQGEQGPVIWLPDVRPDWDAGPEVYLRCRHGVCSIRLIERSA
jgi:hypothetical protein